MQKPRWLSRIPDEHERAEALVRWATYTAAAQLPGRHTLKELAHHIGVNRFSLTHYANGYAPMPIEMRKAINKILGAEVIPMELPLPAKAIRSKN